MDKFRYRGVCCPVCNKLFEKNDDVVVCPDCGAPYHRECYKIQGECLLKDKHGTGYEFSLPSNEAIQEDFIICPVCNSKVINSAKYCPNCGNFIEKDNINKENEDVTQNFQQPEDLFADMNIDFYGGVNKEKDFDGVCAKELVDYIKIGTPYYLKVFEQIKDIGKSRFNFASFIFSGIWFMYRKMYKIGIILFIVMAALLCASIFAEYTLSLPILRELFSSAGLDISSNSFDIASAQQLAEPLSQMTYIDKLKFMLPSAMRLLQFVIMIFCGAKANKIYMKSCMSNIKNINKSVSDVKEKDELTEKFGGVNRGIALSLLATYFILSNFLPYVFIS